MSISYWLTALARSIFFFSGCKIEGLVYFTQISASAHYAALKGCSRFKTPLKPLESEQITHWDPEITRLTHKHIVLTASIQAGVFSSLSNWSERFIQNQCHLSR